jgi:hypothetical protein
VIAQCELKARDRYNFRNDSEYTDAMDYLKVCMLSLGYERRHRIQMGVR